MTHSDLFWTGSFGGQTRCATCHTLTSGHLNSLNHEQGTNDHVLANVSRLLSSPRRSGYPYLAQEGLTQHRFRRRKSGALLFEGHVPRPEWDGSTYVTR